MQIHFQAERLDAVVKGEGGMDIPAEANKMLLHMELSIGSIGFAGDTEPVFAARARETLSQLRSDARGDRSSPTDPFDWPEYDRKEAERIIANYRARVLGGRKRVLGVREWVLEADSSVMAARFHFVPEVRE